MDINEQIETVNKFEVVTLSLAESSVESSDSDSSLCSEYTSVPLIEESVELVSANVSSVQKITEKQVNTALVDTYLHKTTEVDVNTSFECMKNAFKKRIWKTCSAESQGFCSQPEEVTNYETAEECCITEVVLNDEVTNCEIAEELCIREEILDEEVTNREKAEEQSIAGILDDVVTNTEIAFEFCKTEVILDDEVTNREIAAQRCITKVIQDDEVTNREIAEECSITKVIQDDEVTIREIAAERCTTEVIQDNEVTSREIAEEGCITEVIQDSDVRNLEITFKFCKTEVILDDEVVNREIGEEQTITEVILNNQSCSEERLCVDTAEACISGGVNYLQDLESCSGDSEIFRSTNDEESLSNHSGENLPKCRICKEVFGSLNDLTIHLSSIHLGKSLNFVCKICNEPFNVKANLITHVQESHLKRRYKKNSGIYNSRPVSEPEVQHSQSNSDETPAENSNAKRSAKSKRKFKSYQCDICNKCFTLKRILKDHLECHMGLQIKCSHCNKQYSSQDSLNKHLKKITSQKLYKCSLCPNTYTFRFELKVHLDRKHKQGTPQPCEICGKIYYTGKCLRAHIKRCHSQSERVNKRVVNEHKYNRCGNTYRDSTHLQKHLSKVNYCLGVRRLSCRVCGKSYTSLGSLLNHFKKNHGEMLKGIPKGSITKYILNEQQLASVCEYCGQVFQNTPYFKDHLKSHLYGKQHICHQCGRKYIVKRSLQLHVRRKHSVECKILC